MILGYARFAPHDLNPEAQQAALREAGCESVLADRGVADVARRRPQLEKALRRLRAGDELVVGKLSDLAGTLGDLFALMRQIEERGSTLRSLAEGLDTKTATSGRIVEAIAGFERGLAGERIQIGMKAAQRRGQHVGRPPLLDDPKAIRLAAKRVDAGEPVPTVARSLGVSRQTLRRAFHAHLHSGQPPGGRRSA